MSNDNTRDAAEPSLASAGSHWPASAFEAWAARHGLQCRPCGSHYLDSATEWAWLGWQAATLTDDQPQTCPHVVGRTTQHCSLNFTLTDGERMAVAYFAEFGQWPAGKRHAYTLRALLERLG